MGGKTVFSFLDMAKSLFGSGGNPRKRDGNPPSSPPLPRTVNRQRVSAAFILLTSYHMEEIFGPYLLELVLIFSSSKLNKCRTQRLPVAAE
jgi:hypothetical protein